MANKFLIKYMVQDVSFIRASRLLFIEAGTNKKNQFKLYCDQILKFNTQFNGPDDSTQFIAQERYILLLGPLHSKTLLFCLLDFSAHKQFHNNVFTTHIGQLLAGNKTHLLSCSSFTTI